MTRPRAADDFAAIRARIEELRRDPPPTEPEARPLTPRPYQTPSAVTPNANPRRLPPAIRQRLFPAKAAAGDGWRIW
jgi:hypothetical protein